jgi:acetyl-CoA carboxylase biotin carboxyl carrier protein
MNNKEIKDLMRAFDASSLSKLKVINDGVEISMQKGGDLVAPVSVAPAPIQTPVVPALSSSEIPSAESTKAVSGDTIKSVMVGTFYAAASPDSPPFVKVGDTVKKGQTLCILEAMKIMNEIEAEFDCKIVDILVSDGSLVEYDMPLFVVERI